MFAGISIITLRFPATWHSLLHGYVSWNWTHPTILRSICPPINITPWPCHLNQIHLLSPGFLASSISFSFFFSCKLFLPPLLCPCCSLWMECPSCPAYQVNTSLSSISSRRLSLRHTGCVRSLLLVPTTLSSPKHQNCYWRCRKFWPQ